MKLKLVAVFILFGLMLGLAYHIEVKARPVKNVTVEMRHGESHAD
jgi:hypothetical protein